MTLSIVKKTFLIHSLTSYFLPLTCLFPLTCPFPSYLLYISSFEL